MIIPHDRIHSNRHGHARVSPVAVAVAAAIGNQNIGWKDAGRVEFDRVILIDTKVSRPISVVAETRWAVTIQGGSSWSTAAAPSSI